MTYAGLNILHLLEPGEDAIISCFTIKLMLSSPSKLWGLYPCMHSFSRRCRKKFPVSGIEICKCDVTGILCVYFLAISCRKKGLYKAGFEFEWPTGVGTKDRHEYLKTVTSYTIVCRLSVKNSGKKIRRNCLPFTPIVYL